jgi:hypothetical protein
MRQRKCSADASVSRAGQRHVERQFASSRLSSVRAAAAKVLLDQLTFGPANNIAFMSFWAIAIERADVIMLLPRLAHDLPRVQLAAWRYWPIVAAVNYRVRAERARGGVRVWAHVGADEGLCVCTFFSMCRRRCGRCWPTWRGCCGQPSSWCLRGETRPRRCRRRRRLHDACCQWGNFAAAGAYARAACSAASPATHCWGVTRLAGACSEVSGCGVTARSLVF